MFGCLLAALSLLFSLVHSSAQTPANSLRLEIDGPILRLRYSLADTNGRFILVRSAQLMNLFEVGEVLASGPAASNLTGVLDMARPTSSPVFFGLRHDRNTVVPVVLVPLPVMVKILAGTFEMGSPETEADHNSDETQHTVTLTKDFYMSKYEVTQAEYLAVMGNNPSYFTTRDYSTSTDPRPGGNKRPVSPDLNRPVEQVSWNAATNYCGKLTALERAAGRLPAGWEYRLPTEAEWEYACRAGTSTTFYYGPDLLTGMANFDGRYEYVGDTGTRSVNNPNGTYLAQTTAVGSYQPPNAFGLYDMHGNVWEWCSDWYKSYADGSVTDPRGPATGSNRVVRGGCWYGRGWNCRSARRPSMFGQDGSFEIGFRPVLAPGQP